MRRRCSRRRPRQKSRPILRTSAACSSDRRTVVADRRRDADGRRAAEHRSVSTPSATLGVDRVRVQAGVTLIELDDVLARAGRYYPPAPTFRGAFVGGTVSTNAAGAATFKYGTTRQVGASRSRSSSPAATCWTSIEASHARIRTGTSSWRCRAARSACRFRRIGCRPSPSCPRAISPSQGWI